ncbi:DMT family transporter [Paracandidimonas soli]|uniref:Threonine/homoserine efflux transporter RhtA n=1 Tax=Paracandidimonas soli TaxID=1917182 RepID=A0A4R3UMP5_9BURK|nr:DMT family transporter [Paracandidimonas soli]TCU92986.1 threonine/homoserine efflux transporter RhtA [Paracandidimonas soli]
MSTTASQQSNIRTGILCILVGIFCLTLSDSLAKWLGPFYSPIQILFLRAAIALPLVTMLVLSLGGRRALRTQHIGVHLLRGAINVASASCFYLGLTLLPLAENTAIAFCAPLFVTAISVAFLGEKVSRGGWLAILVGFAGVVVIVRPSPGNIQWAALLPLATAFGYAVMMVSAKRISARESMLTTMFYIVLGQLVFASLPLAAVWKPIDWSHLPGFIGIAVCSTMGLGLITQAFRMAPASIVAPFDYFGLISAGLLGWFFWNELPDAWFYVGALMIAASGVYVALSNGRRR